jgi:uncharacterized protein (TIGR02466 family)
MQVTPTDLFPTRVWIFDAPELKQHHESWVNQMQQWRNVSASPKGFSNRQGWNSAKTVFSNEAFAPLKNAANHAFVHALKDMKLANSVSFGLEGWVNMHDAGGFNMPHTHPNVLLSACYYVRVPEGSGALALRDPRPGVVLTGPVGTGVHCRSMAVAKVLPTEGQLVVFPHWLEHYVEPNEGNHQRISIAMNAQLVSVDSNNT